MTAPKPDAAIEPVLLNKQQAAALLGMGAETFRLRLAALYREGFPQPDATFGKYYRGAIMAWLDRRHGLGEQAVMTIAPPIDIDAERAKEKWN